MERMRPAVAFLWLPLTAGCGGSVATSGYDVAESFPRAANWFWQYDNDANIEQVWWISEGPTEPQGESWLTHTWWFIEQADLVTDWLGERDQWAIRAFWAERADGVYWMGWSTNPDGPLSALGEEFFESPGVPFAMGSARRGQSWERDLAGRHWTTTATDEPEVLEFNSQRIEDSWRVTIESDLGDTPMEGSWWLIPGPGVAQWDVSALRPPQGSPWQHFYNTELDLILGAE
jgi:hypothetical protein